MEYHNNFLPGDMVGIKDDGYIEIPEGYFYSGMILKEKAPIHTFTYYVMLYPKNTITDNQIKIIEVPEEHLILKRFINRDHYDTGSTKYRAIHLLNNVLKTIINIESTEETESLLKFMAGYLQGMIDFEQRNLNDHFVSQTSRNCGKSYLSSTYGEVLNNGKIKQSN
jgi:hypothetical protein